MGLFKDSVLGKILGTVGKVVLPIVSKIPVIGNIIAGAAGMVGGLVGNLGKKSTASQPTALSSIAANAQGLVTGLVSQQNQAMAESATKQAADLQNLKVYNQLISNGMTPAQALAASGLSQTPSGTLITGSINPIILIFGAAIGGFILLKLLKVIK